jgi:predicted nucleic acid-binding protein
MSLPIAFWDSSALIPLFVAQTQTERASQLFANYRVAVWWSTAVEIISGLTRLERMGEINHDEFLTGKRLAQTVAAT